MPKVSEVRQKLLVVTGGSRGIGRAVCLQAAKQGYHILFSYHKDEVAANFVVSEITRMGGTAVAIQGDLSDSDAIKKLFFAIDNHPAVFVGLVNNAGTTGTKGDFVNTSMKTVRAVFELNVFALMECCQQAVVRLSENQNGSGCSIVNLSSGAAQKGAPHAYTWYGASKAAVETFTLGLARETAITGLRINAVSPGVIATDIHRTTGGYFESESVAKTIPMQRLGDPDEVAQAVLWLLSDAASYVTGSVLRVSGGR